MATTVHVSRNAVRIGGLLVAVGTAVSLVAACSGGSGSATTAAATSSVSQPTSTGRRGGFGGIDPAQLQKIRDCLTAAGIPLPTGRPSGFPTRVRPSDFPTDGTRPSGFPSGGGGGGRGLGQAFANPQARAALEACGITIPTFSPRPTA